MAFDAVILAGGRATRLGGTAKATLVFEGQPLLLRAVEAAAGARSLVVVGDAAPGLPEGVLVTRESPAYGGPVAALGAGFALLPVSDRQDENELVLVLACDVPGIGAAVVPLLRAARDDPTIDGALAVDPDGARQYLAAVFRRASLGSALRRSPLEGLSMRRLVEDMRLAEVPVAAGVADDVDDWADARRLRVSAEPGTELGTDG
jgi:molybdopterin-guanine dinucleotide biosynthesis protein A